MTVGISIALVLTSLLGWYKALRSRHCKRIIDDKAMILSFVIVITATISGHFVGIILQYVIDYLN